MGAEISATRPKYFSEGFNFKRVVWSLRDRLTHSASRDDARLTREFDDHYVIQPQFGWWAERTRNVEKGTSVADDFVYSSEINDTWMSVEDIRTMIRPFEEAARGS